MDDDGSNVEWIGHLNIGRRCTRSSSRTAGSCSARWSRRGCAAITCGASGPSIPTAPTGARSSAPSTPARHHRLLPLPDAALRRQHRRREYYNLNNTASARTSSCPSQAPEGYPRFGPANPRSAQRLAANGRHVTGGRAILRLPFTPVRHGDADALHQRHDEPPPRSVLDGAEVAARRQVHAPVRRPGQPPADGLGARPGRTAMRTEPSSTAASTSSRTASRRRAGADAAHQERSEVQRAMAARPRAYKRIYGVDEPQRCTALANDGKQLDAPARGNAVRPGRHVEPLQARELSRGVVPPGR